MNAIYARQSVEKENSISIETQIEFCKAMIRPDERSQKIEIYIDEGSSGGNTNRKDFQRMMRDIQHGKIKKVITYKLDRISRSLYDFVGILKIFKENGVEFVSSQEAFDTSSVYGDLILKILMVFAEFERTSIINRVRDAYAKRTDIGLYMGGRRQYGFDLQDTVINGIKTKKHVPVAEEIEQIQYIFEVYAQEHISLRKLLNNLVSNGIKPNTGKDWTTAKLSTILKNPVYVKADSDIYDYFESHGVRMVDDLMKFDGTRGVQLYGRATHDAGLEDWSDMKLVLAQHQGVVPSTIWLKCQRKIEKNKQIGNSLSNQTSWLAGKLVCGKCGHTMTTTKSQKSNGEYRRYFNCTGKTHKRTCSGIKHTVYVDDMEKMIEGFITEKLSSIGTIRKSAAHSSASEQNTLKLKLKDIEQQQKKLIELLLTDSFNSEMITMMNQKSSDLLKQRQILLQKINDLKDQNEEIEVAIQLSQKWKYAKYEEKKAVVQVLIQNIIMHEDGTPEIIWTI